jgi:micrococcal nuclease
VIRRALFCLLFSFPALAEIPPGMVRAGEGKVAEILDGYSLRLIDGRMVRLAGLAPPAFGFEKMAKEQLSALAGRGAVLMAHDPGAGVDRHGRLLVHLEGGDGLWLQEEMLRVGLARFQSRPDAKLGAARLLGVEAKAREAKLGLWADKRHAILSASEPAVIRSGSFQIVEGKVVSARRIRDMIYLNFGTDWKSDFTLEIDRAGQSALRKAKISPLKLEGQSIRVRGQVFFRNGPAMQISHGEQIELQESSKE